MSGGYYNDTVSVRLTVKCPICGTGRDCEIKVLLVTGEVPYTSLMCDVCGCVFAVRATMDISVVAETESGD